MDLRDATEGLRPWLRLSVAGLSPPAGGAAPAGTGRGLAGGAKGPSSGLAGGTNGPSSVSARQRRRAIEVLRRAPDAAWPGARRVAARPGPAAKHCQSHGIRRPQLGAQTGGGANGAKSGPLPPAWRVTADGGVLSRCRGARTSIRAAVSSRGCDEPGLHQRADQSGPHGQQQRGTLESQLVRRPSTVAQRPERPERPGPAATHFQSQGIRRPQPAGRPVARNRQARWPDSRPACAPAAPRCRPDTGPRRPGRPGAVRAGAVPAAREGLVAVRDAHAATHEARGCDVKARRETRTRSSIASTRLRAVSQREPASESRLSPRGIPARTSIRVTPISSRYPSENLRYREEISRLAVSLRVLRRVARPAAG